MSHFHAEFNLFNASAEGLKPGADGGLTFPFMAVDGATSPVMSFSRQACPGKRFDGCAGHFWHPGY